MKKTILMALLVLSTTTAHSQSVDDLFSKKTVDYLKSVPFDVNRTSLYSAAELYAGYDPKSEETFETCYDTKVYKHFIANGKQAQNVEESLARTLHDHCIHVALDEFFKKYDSRFCLGIMGGHALLRTDPMYKKVVLLSKRLTEQGFIMLSGGGPGAMEATHLGAWMAGRTEQDVDAAIDILKIAPSFKDKGWLSASFEVMERYPRKGDYVSLGIPTYLYGHEPSAPFATHIAKFFENSIREDLILTYAFGGIIYTPGSAGTMQEIFQDAVQNHYLSFGYSSPMIFLGTEFWTKELPVYPFLEELVKLGKYKNMQLTLTDDFDEIVKELETFRSQTTSRLVEEGGTGPYKAIMKAEPTLGAHTVFVPQDLSKFDQKHPLPVLVWGNGACNNSPFEHYKFLNEIASYGFMVVATGYIPMTDDPYKGPMSTTQQQIESMDWVERQNADPMSPYYQKLDVKNIAAAGMSCGGLQTLYNCADPRIKTMMICNSGLFNQQNAHTAVGGMPMPPKEKLSDIHSSVIYILGGKPDIAYENGMDDFHRISHVAACAANLPVGHGGTYAQPHGGEFAVVALAWLQWQLKGDKQAAKMFKGKNCLLSKREGWTIEKNQRFNTLK